MKARVVASVVLAAGIVLGTAGCNLVAPQATTRKYDASDGVSGNVGDVKIRNAFLIANGDSINLVATIVDGEDVTTTLSIEPNSSADDTQQLQLDPSSTTVVGNDTRVQWNDFKVPLGSLFPVFFQYGDKTGVQLKLPVLDGSLNDYSSYTPTPVETATPSEEAPTPSATPTPTATTPAP